MNKKICFWGSIRAGRDDVGLYEGIVTHLRKYGEVLTHHVADKELKVWGEVKVTDVDIHKRELKFLEQADVIIAEVSTPSLGVGYNLGRALGGNPKKPILCLYRPQEGRRLSGMILGADGIKNVEYTDLKQAIVEIDKFFSSLVK
jgi:2'-deoxynucleoside 5'-phosphate N-hydrolase